ncbi:hypothetical protein [Pengzhenrongella phosphoraccumulans]|uniref:hypothetical protein n=1 Tax=Pengzhenrongella phosphoraccumulans TaxID=3114394 RepID=UPI003890412B
MTEITLPCILLRVNKLWSEGMTEDDVYDITRGWWHVGPKREQAQYAVAVAKGVVRGVFLVHDWRPRHYEDDGLTPAKKVRWAFDGEPAADQTHLIGLDVKHLFPQGAANPVKYLNLNQTEPAPTVSWEEPSDLADSRVTVVRDTCAALQANPVLHLSLGSKELFHSNLLGWLFATPAVARDALAPWLEASATHTGHRVFNELHHLDLIVELDGARPIVVENKVFSLPDEGQLDGYTATNIPATGLAPATKLLLSLADPGWPGGTYDGWTWVRYPDLARRVAAAIQRHLPDDDFTLGLVERWALMIDGLQTLTDHVSPHDPADPLLLDGDTVELLRPVSLHDALQKFRNFAMAHQLGQRFAELGLRCDGLQASFSKGMPILTVHVDVSDGSTVGWQLQGSQWRRFLIVPEALRGKGEAAKAKQVAYADAVHSRWFAFDDEQKAGPFAPAPSSTYKHFAPDFVYDYVKVPAISISQVLELGEISLRAALDHAQSVTSLRP